MNNCVNCGINRGSSIGDTCPSKKHTGGIGWIQQWYETSDKGSGYYTNVQIWSCCKGRSNDPPCQTVQVAHVFPN